MIFMSDESSLCWYASFSFYLWGLMNVREVIEDRRVRLL